ncbi:MAG TPA: hypothetical protein VER55_15965, partial [Ardenticatenaceae bacterium]|nr:hypothetical protein [Ardenticatenaceae bacterium]
RNGIEAHAGGGATVRVWYPSPRRLRAEFAPWFRPVRTVGIGVLLPPPYLDHLVERRPALFDRLRRIEGRVAGSFPATLFNDHYLIDFERND